MQDLIILKSEIVAERDAISNDDGRAEIESKVTAYREEVERDFAERKQQALAERDADIKSIDRLIKRQQDKQQQADVGDQIILQGGNT